MKFAGDLEQKLGRGVTAIKEAVALLQKPGIDYKALYGKPYPLAVTKIVIGNVSAQLETAVWLAQGRKVNEAIQWGTLGVISSLSKVPGIVTRITEFGLAEEESFLLEK